MKSKKAVVAGHICLDILPEMGYLRTEDFENQFKPGHLIQVGQAKFSTGGPVSNVGLALHKLGITTQLIAKTGNDPYGEIIRKTIAGFSPNLLGGIRIDPVEPTSYSVIISPPGIDRIFLHCPGVNDTFSADDIDFNLLRAADLMHFGYPPVMRRMYQDEGEELTNIFQRAKETGITTSLDMTFPDAASAGGKVDWEVILKNTLPFVDLFTPSVEEITFMLHKERYNAMVANHGGLLANHPHQLITDLGSELIAMGAKMVLLKLGDQGAYLQTTRLNKFKNLGRAIPPNSSSWANRKLWSPCYQVDVIGTTGSGDATIAGLLSALLRDLSPLEALNAAVAVGASNVEAQDALGGIRNWDETMDRIARGWKKHTITVNAPNWIWNDQYAMWEYKLLE